MNKHQNCYSNKEVYISLYFNKYTALSGLYNSTYKKISFTFAARKILNYGF